MTSNTKQQSKEMINDYETILRFQELEVEKVYVVKGLTNFFTTEFGVSYILMVQEESSKKLIKVWSTKHLTKYIRDKEPTKKWKFTVRINDNNKMKYPEIKGYSRYEVITMYDSE